MALRGWRWTYKCRPGQRAREDQIGPPMSPGDLRHMNIAEKTRFDFVAGEPDLQHDSLSPEQVESALRLIPSHGWPGGWSGRRSRAELVLTALGHVPRQHINEMVAGDVVVVEDTAVIATVEGTVTLDKADETLLCGPCALARWLHALDLMAIGPERVVAATIARAAPLHAGSPHLCHSPIPIAAATRPLLLFPRQPGTLLPRQRRPRAATARPPTTFQTV